MEILDGSRNLTQQLTYELGKAIVQGKYQVDAAFPTEAELSAQFNISRSVTREAVKMLTAKGLISSRPRKGIRVQAPNSWNMFDNDVLNWTLSAKPSLALLLEFTQLCVAIEPEAVALACRNATKNQIRSIAEALDCLDAAVEGKDDPFDADTLFHCRILEASNNRFFIQFCGFVQAASRMKVACGSQFGEELPQRIKRYRLMLKSIDSGAEQEGRNYMRELLLNTITRIDMSLASFTVKVEQKAELVTT